MYGVFSSEVIPMKLSCKEKIFMILMLSVCTCMVPLTDVVVCLCIVHVTGLLICLSVFFPGYLERWSDSNIPLVLFTQYILNSVSVAYICIIWELVNSSERWLIHAEWWLFPTTADQCSQNTTISICSYLFNYSPLLLFLC